jgi:hypothetical protein
MEQLNTPPSAAELSIYVELLSVNCTLPSILNKPPSSSMLHFSYFESCESTLVYYSPVMKKLFVELKGTVISLKSGSMS